MAYACWTALSKPVQKSPNDPEIRIELVALNRVAGVRDSFDGQIGRELSRGVGRVLINDSVLCPHEESRALHPGQVLGPGPQGKRNEVEDPDVQLSDRLKLCLDVHGIPTRTFLQDPFPQVIVRQSLVRFSLPSPTIAMVLPEWSCISGMPGRIYHHNSSDQIWVADRSGKRSGCAHRMPYDRGGAQIEFGNQCGQIIRQILGGMARFRRCGLPMPSRIRHYDVVFALKRLGGASPAKSAVGETMSEDEWRTGYCQVWWMGIPSRTPILSG